MAQKDTKGFVTHNSFREKNDKYMLEKKSVADRMKEINSPYTPTPNRAIIASAAATRAKEEEKKKKERREMSQRQKEEAERAEEEKLEAMKRAAAEKSEALRIKEEIKARVARSNAAVAASERAEKAATVLPAHHLHTTQGTSIKNDTQERENVYKSNGTQLKESAKENADLVLHNKIKRPKETVRKEELLSSYKAAGEPVGPVGRKEAIIAVGTHGAASTNDMHTLISSSQTKDQEKEITDVRTSEIEQQMHKNTMHSHHNERESMSTAEKVEVHLASQNGARPKEKNGEPSIYAVNNQAGQNSDQLYKSRSSTAIQQNENNSYRQEKEIISVTGNEASQSEADGGKKEIVSVTGHEKYTVGESEASSSRYEDKKPNVHHTELNKRTVENSEVEEHIPEDIQGYQNGPPSANGDPRDTNHQREHSRRSQQYYTPPAQRNEGFWPSHQHPHHREQWNSNHNYDKRGQRPQNQPPFNSHPHGQQTSQLHGPQRALICGSCGEKFNLKKKLPRNLYCGHSLCTLCISEQTYYGHHVACPLCPLHTRHVKNASECPVNQPLLKILSEESMQYDVAQEKESKGPHLPEGSDIRQHQSQPGNDSVARGGMGQLGHQSLPPRSPHGSKCLESGVRPSSYCCTCKVWVCARCAEAEHSTKRCSVKPLKDQLAAMKQDNDQEGKRAQEQLNNSLQSLENSLDEDKTFLMWMRVAYERIEKKNTIMEKKLEEGRELMKKLTDAMEAASIARNLPEALAEFQGKEDMAKTAQQWGSSAELNATASSQETTVCLKHLLKRTLESLEIDENGKSGMYVVDKLLGSELCSELRVEGGRFHLHALRKGQATSQAFRALPVKCIKLCQATGSTLIFLDLSWGEVDRGRLYIRLTGDTLRGRQFISLCIGEEGISFRGTCFHRVWWKGLPGEHVWTGDYEKSDGSGGRSLLSPNSHKDIPAGRKVPISAGLVAGRYEKEDISTIFRIYTKEEKEGKDEAGFGQVEFGLNIVKEAVRVRNITDVVISDCGLVLEM